MPDADALRRNTRSPNPHATAPSGNTGSPNPHATAPSGKSRSPNPHVTAPSGRSRSTAASMELPRFTPLGDASLFAREPHPRAAALVMSSTGGERARLFPSFPSAGERAGLFPSFPSGRVTNAAYALRQRSDQDGASLRGSQTHRPSTSGLSQSGGLSQSQSGGLSQSGRSHSGMSQSGLVSQPSGLHAAPTFAVFGPPRSAGGESYRSGMWRESSGAMASDQVSFRVCSGPTSGAVQSGLPN